MLLPVLRARRYGCARALALGLTGPAVGRAKPAYARTNLHFGRCAQGNYQNGVLNGASVARAGYGPVAWAAAPFPPTSQCKC